MPGYDTDAHQVDPRIKYSVSDQQDRAGASQAIAKWAILKHLAKTILVLLALASLTQYLGFPTVSRLSCRIRFSATRTSSRYTIPDLYTATLEDLNYGLEHRHFTSRDLVAAYLARIEEVNNELHAVLETNPHALAEAAQMDSARESGRVRGPLHGIPILLKDNIATARLNQTYMNTTAGSYALLGSSKATVATKLKASGAVILGKANLQQWSGYRTSSLPSSWSARGGLCTGAYYPDQNPLGSSSGSGVATSIGLTLAALGTETHGSVVRHGTEIFPSHANNLCGIKPTVGLTSRSMVIPISSTQDSVGTMAKDCKTAAALLSVIAGKDVRFDAATAAIPFDKIPDYAKACSANGLRGARIGVPNDFIASQGLDSTYWSAFNQTSKIISELGAYAKQDIEFAALSELLNNEAEMTVWHSEFPHALQHYLNQLYINPNNISTLEALIDYTKNNHDEEYPAMDIDWWISALAHADQSLDSSIEYQTAHAKDTYLGTTGTVIGALDRYDLDALIVPSYIAPKVSALGGLPVVTVPMGFYPPDYPIRRDAKAGLVLAGPNIPFGLAFVGRPFSEEKLIAFACAFEAATQVRKKGPDPYIDSSTTVAENEFERRAERPQEWAMSSNGPEAKASDEAILCNSYWHHRFHLLEEEVNVRLSLYNSDRLWVAH